jgi:hypothetical protein
MRHAQISATANEAQQLMPQATGASTRRIACAGQLCASSVSKKRMERSIVMDASTQTQCLMNGYAKNSPRLLLSRQPLVGLPARHVNQPPHSTSTNDMKALMPFPDSSKTERLRLKLDAPVLPFSL